MEKIYFASPWFCETQEEREERLKAKLRELGYKVHSPKEANNVTGSFVEPEFRKAVFDSDIENIDNADILFGVIDGQQCENVEFDLLKQSTQAIDPGTSFECGYAYALRKSRSNSPIIVYYAETYKGMPMNLMLHESADIIITEFDDLVNLPKYIKAARAGIRKTYEGLTE